MCAQSMMPSIVDPNCSLVHIHTDDWDPWTGAGWPEMSPPSPESLRFLCEVLRICVTWDWVDGGGTIRKLGDWHTVECGFACVSSGVCVDALVTFHGQFCLCALQFFLHAWGVWLPGWICFQPALQWILELGLPQRWHLLLGMWCQMDDCLCGSTPLVNLFHKKIQIQKFWLGQVALISWEENPSNQIHIHTIDMVKRWDHFGELTAPLFRGCGQNPAFLSLFHLDGTNPTMLPSKVELQYLCCGKICKGSKHKNDIIKSCLASERLKDGTCCTDYGKNCWRKSLIWWNFEFLLGWQFKLLRNNSN